MAEIDKSLPNEVEKIVAPEENEIEQVVEETTVVSPGDTEISENEDGSVDINFDPNQIDTSLSADHGANLAEFLPDDVLGRLGSTLYQNYQDYKNSRKDWERSYREGLDLLNRTFSRCKWCNSSCSCGSCNTVSIFSL
jgi:hypothetical protein